MTDPTPVRFSIIIPVLNRAAMISRAIDSVLAQSHSDFELFVVDDGSTDGTADVVARYADPRVKLLRHPKNRGVCAARNTAIAQATGDWCVFLDSDFELLPGGLEGLAVHCRNAPADAGHMASACRWDRRSDTPDPMPAADAVMSWPEFLRFLATLRTPEWFNCIRRECFDHFRYPEGRAYEGGLHMRIAHRYRYCFTRDCFVLIHTDAVDRITLAPPEKAVRRMLRDARDSADDAEQVLAEFGDDLRTYAPSILHEYREQAALQSLLAGQRARALGHYALLKENALRSPRRAAILALGMLGPTVLARAMAHWAWTRHRKA